MSARGASSAALRHRRLRDDKAGLSPAAARYLPGKGPSYEVEESLGSDLGPQHNLLLRMPEALASPRRIVVEGLWHQPQFASRALGRMQVSTPGRHMEGVRWEMVGTWCQHRTAPCMTTCEG